MKKKRGDKNFKGLVKVYNEEIFIDTKTGEGFNFVLKKIDPLLSKMAAKTYIPGYRFEDIKQELVVIAIEGMKNFNNAKNVKLSTFLHIHLKNKIISKILSKNRLAADATYSEVLEEDTPAKNFKIREEIPFSCIKLSKYDEPEKKNFEEKIDANRTLFQYVEDYDFEVVFNSLIKNLDSDCQKILRKVFYEEKTIIETAKDLGMQPWAVSKKLKSPEVRELFLRFSDLETADAE
jgi:RNA polymerase sigma factor (sigma-70 family)